MMDMKCAFIPLLWSVMFVVIVIAQTQMPDQLSDEELHQNQIPPPHQQPSHEEIKTAISDLVSSNIDTDKDGFVTSTELKDWIEAVHKKLIEDNVKRQWGYYQPDIQMVHSWEGYNPEPREVLSWDKYKNLTYPEEFLNEENDNPHAKNMQIMYKRAERRWELSDINGDSVLTIEEFKGFIHPEEVEKTKDILVEEASEDMDLDSNQEISLDEYMNHLHSLATEEEKSDQSWSQVQQNHFTAYLDVNKDGVLNKDELKDWLLPKFDRHEAESTRLVENADSNADQKLTMKEIISNYEHFFALLPPEFWQKYSPAEDNLITEPTRHDEF